MAMPTRKPLNLPAMAIVNNARPYTTNAGLTKIFRAPSGQSSFAREAEKLRTADWNQRAQEIRRGTPPWPCRACAAGRRPGRSPGRRKPERT